MLVALLAAATGANAAQRQATTQSAAHAFDSARLFRTVNVYAPTQEARCSKARIRALKKAIAKAVRKKQFKRVKALRRALKICLRKPKPKPKPP
ncbi:MAG: hypothetical protein M3R70_07670, partial [Actinomycetota bacterium]|nr:hypothetical protein [Actinomycetota bacterium]